MRVSDIPFENVRPNRRNGAVPVNNAQLFNLNAAINDMMGVAEGDRPHLAMLDGGPMPIIEEEEEEPDLDDFDDFDEDDDEHPERF